MAGDRCRCSLFDFTAEIPVAPAAWKYFVGSCSSCPCILAYTKDHQLHVIVSPDTLLALVPSRNRNLIYSKATLLLIPLPRATLWRAIDSALCRSSSSAPYMKQPILRCHQNQLGLQAQRLKRWSASRSVSFLTIQYTSTRTESLGLCGLLS